jgi:hypothetical protein
MTFQDPSPNRLTVISYSLQLEDLSPVVQFESQLCNRVAASCTTPCFLCGVETHKTHSLTHRIALHDQKQVTHSKHLLLLSNHLSL